MKGLECDVPDNWWPEYNNDDKNRYVICDVDFTRDKQKPWHQRNIFAFEYELQRFHLNFEGLLVYVDPGTVPGSLTLETGIPWSDLPVSIVLVIRSHHAGLARLLRLTPTYATLRPVFLPLF